MAISTQITGLRLRFLAMDAGSITYSHMTKPMEAKKNIAPVKSAISHSSVRRS